MRVTMVALGLAFAAMSAQAATINDFCFLSGQWSLAQDGKITEEWWLPPAAGAMHGVNRVFMQGSDKHFFEYLRITQHEGKWRYVAQPSGKAPTTFSLTRVDDHVLQFENAQHDFPQVIRYEKLNDNEMLVTVEKVKADDSSLTWRFTRQSAFGDCANAL